MIKDPEIVEVVSVLAFGATLQRLTEAIEGAGMTLFARIDHAAGAEAIGTPMPPSVVLIYGHPRGGTPIMLASPQAALDLPLRVLVRAAPDGQVLVGFHPIAAVLGRVGVPEALARRLEPAQEGMVAAVQRREA